MSDNWTIIIPFALLVLMIGCAVGLEVYGAKKRAECLQSCFEAGNDPVYCDSAC